MTLARFGTARYGGFAEAPNGEGLLWLGTGVDARAAGTKPNSHTAYKFIVLGVHSSLDSAREVAAIEWDWMQGATEQWKGVLQPFRHVGEINWLDRSEPGLIFDCPSDGIPEGPFAVMTSAGYHQVEGWTERAAEFGTGVAAVRMGMTAVPGLRSQQTFFFNSGYDFDSITLTFWDDFASMRDFAYGPGVHKDKVLMQKSEHLADRTSFSRLAIIESSGAWHGTVL